MKLPPSRLTFTRGCYPAGRTVHQGDTNNIRNRDIPETGTLFKTDTSSRREKNLTRERAIN